MILISTGSKFPTPDNPADKARRQRRRAKRTRIQLGESLTVQDTLDVLDQKAVGMKAVQATQPDGRGAGGLCPKVRGRGVHGKPGHNARTYQEAAESSNLAVSDVTVASSQ